MTIEDLAAQIADIKAANEEQNFLNEKRAFYDKFGTAFSNNDAVGLALLGKMAQHGIPMKNATMDVVQDILYDMRTELNNYLSAIQVNNQQAQDLVQKVNAMEQSISQVTGAPPEAAVPPAPEAVLPPEAAVPPAPEAGLPPEAAVPPAPEGGTTLSDERMKDVVTDALPEDISEEDRATIEGILAKYDHLLPKEEGEPPEVSVEDVVSPESGEEVVVTEVDDIDPYDIKQMAQTIAAIGRR